MERDYDGDFRVFASDIRTPEEIGNQAAKRTLQRAGARKPKTGSYPVLFDERISSSLIGHLLAASYGTNITRGASWLRDAMEQPVLPDTLSLTEYPHRKRMHSSKPLAAEGLPAAAGKIGESGV